MAHDGAGKVPITRYGFPLVPDFGGTAHAYCGSTLDACLGDLLAWQARPTKESAQKGNIIKSRTRNAATMLLAQPYCPLLFRQGVQEGPQLLLKSLRGELTWKQIKKAWTEVEKKAKEKKQASAKWPLSLELPCRRCTDKNGGVEVLHPLTA